MQCRSPLTTGSLCVGCILPLLVFLGSFTARLAAGQSLWEGNGHYYLVVEEELSWEEARSRAESMLFMGVQGHLTTITSEDENTFVTTQLGNINEAWLGGKQRPDSEEPAGGWQWITGEPWVYTNWRDGEPNNFGGSEERLVYSESGIDWNDVPTDPFVTPRFIVEWDVPVDTDCVEPPAGLVGWWPGEGDATDIVGDNSGALQGTATFVPGMVAQGFSFGETDTDAVLIGNSPDLQLQTFTIEGWVKRGSTDIAGRDPNNQGGLIFGYGTGGYGLGMSVEGQLFLSQIDFSEVRSEGLQVTDTDFHHIAVTKSGATVKFYVDGIEELAPDYDPGFFFDTDVAIGNRGDLLRPSFIPDTFIGIIDEVSLYNRALSAEEIAAIFAAGSAGKCKTLQPCTLSLETQSTDGTLSLAFTLGTQEPATWNVWLTAQNEIVRLLSLPLSVLDPPVPVPVTLPFVPPLGTMGILTTLTTPDQGIICSEFATVDTGPVSEDAASIQELQDVLQHLVQ